MRIGSIATRGDNVKTSEKVSEKNALSTTYALNSWGRIMTMSASNYDDDSDESPTIV